MFSPLKISKNSTLSSSLVVRKRKIWEEYNLTATLKLQFEGHTHLHPSTCPEAASHVQSSGRGSLAGMTETITPLQRSRGPGRAPWVSLAHLLCRMQTMSEGLWTC